MRRPLKAILSLVLLAAVAAAGPVSAQAPPADSDGDLIRHLKWRNIGPANMVGRISDFEALDADFTQVLAASASGGVFKSVNAGTTWEPIFDRYGSASIGDVAFFQKDPNIIWVGTGEECSRNSVAWGDGIYKSTDGGKTFARMGLETTHSIGKVLTHPTDPNVAYVAASGHTWGYTGERGLFKTTDGGTTWVKLAVGLPDDGKTGAVDMVMDPSDPGTLYVGFWRRIRRPWRFDSGGPNGGIFKTTDGGTTWTKLTKGLPEGDTGRIGLAISRSKPKVLMAYVEHGFQPRAMISEAGKMKDNPDFRDMTKLGTGIYRSEDGGESWIFVNRMNVRPFYYSHIYINPLEDTWVYSLATNMNFSSDGGRTWTRLEGLHPDFHAMWLDPTNRNRMYVGQDGGASLSHDNGKTWIFFDNFTVSQFYAVSADMRDPYYVYGGLQDNGTWGGPSMSREGKILTDFWYNVGGGDGFHVQIDPTDWRTLYGESQGGAISRTNVETRETKTIRPTQATIVNFKDYFPAVPPPPELKPGEMPPGAGEDPIAAWRKMEAQIRGPFRYNWSSPIVLSPHNPRTVYLGGNHLFKSTDRGDKWLIVSPDLSTNNPEKNKPTGGMTDDTTGAETHGTIITISESPLRPGLLWVGTDDGNVQVSRDGGAAWTNVRPNIPGVPEEIWCSRVEASRFEEGTAYVTFDGHRSDDFHVYVFKTTDYGKTWAPISKGLPDGQPVYVIREDLKVKNLLFLGTEFGAFLSRDGGQSWANFSRNLPTVAVHDLTIHPRENDLIAATHGRGLWIMDDISALRQVNDKVVGRDLVLLEQGRPGTKWLPVNRGGYGRGDLYFKGENPPAGALIDFYCKLPPKKPGTLEITDITGRQKTTFLLDRIEPGLNRLAWDFAFDPAPAMVQSIGSNLKTQLETAAERTETTPEKKAAIGRMLKELEAAGGNYRRIQEIRRKSMDLVGGGMFGRFFGGPPGGPGGRGLEADAGTYVVKITIDDKTLTGTVTVREDPLRAGSAER